MWSSGAAGVNVPQHAMDKSEVQIISPRCGQCGQPFDVRELWVGLWRDTLLHMSCIDQWRADPFRAYNNRSRRGNSLPLLEMTAWPGPPEVRVVRLNLSTRPQESKVLQQGCEPHPRPRPRQVSPLRTRPRRHKKKKTAKSQTDIEDDNKLPMSVTLGRALGAQVQPLMAILMSPRVRTRSLDSDCSGDEQSEDEEKLKPKAPLLSITSLELPDLAGARGPPCQPVRRVRTSVRRARPPAPTLPPPQPPHQQQQQQSSTPNIACAGLALTTARRP